MLYTHTNLHYSQTIISSTLSLVCFAPLQNYTTLKLALIVPTLKSRFVPLQNYTTLKHYPDHNLLESGFVPLQNYTTLKQRENFPATLLCFVPLQNYTTLKPQISKKKRPTNHLCNFVKTFSTFLIW